MNCDFHFDPTPDGRWNAACQRGGCGRSIKTPNPHVGYAPCKGTPRLTEIGGWVLTALEVFGIDKPIWIRLKHALGFRPVCDCEKREQSLNTLGARLQAKVVWIGQRVAVSVKKLLSVVKRN